MNVFKYYLFLGFIATILLRLKLISATVIALPNFSYFFGHTVNKTIPVDVCYISELRLYTLFEYLFSMDAPIKNHEGKSQEYLIAQEELNCEWNLCACFLKISHNNYALDFISFTPSFNMIHKCMFWRTTTGLKKRLVKELEEKVKTWITRCFNVSTSGLNSMHAFTNLNFSPLIILL